MTLRDADYRGPGEESIDPLDETRADILKIKSGIKSRQQIQRERGIDTRRVDAEIEADTFEPSGQTDDGASEDESRTENATEQ